LLFVAQKLLRNGLGFFDLVHGSHRNAQRPNVLHRK
jgi:hypothetical protein